jgi:hypothetical protein
MTQTKHPLIVQAEELCIRSALLANAIEKYLAEHDEPACKKCGAIMAGLIDGYCPPCKKESDTAAVATPNREPGPKFVRMYRSKLVLDDHRRWGIVSPENVLYGRDTANLWVKVNLREDVLIAQGAIEIPVPPEYAVEPPPSKTTEPHEREDESGRPSPDLCAECPRESVGVDSEGTPYCAEHYRTRDGKPAEPLHRYPRRWESYKGFWS